MPAIASRMTTTRMIASRMIARRPRFRCALVDKIVLRVRARHIRHCQQVSPLRQRNSGPDHARPSRPTHIAPHTHIALGETGARRGWAPRAMRARYAADRKLKKPVKSQTINRYGRPWRGGNCHGIRNNDPAPPGRPGRIPLAGLDLVSPSRRPIAAHGMAAVTRTIFCEPDTTRKIGFRFPSPVLYYMS